MYAALYTHTNVLKAIASFLWWTQCLRCNQHTVNTWRSMQ